MKNKKQTAVEYFIEQLDNILELYKSEWDSINEVAKKAKELEKEQIMEAFGDEQSQLQDDGSWKRITSEQYYQETYGKENI